MTDSTKAQAKGRSKGKVPKAVDSNPKQNQKTYEEPSVSNKKNKIDKKICPYCMRVFHLDYQCMKNQVDQLTVVLKKNKISLSQI